MNASERVISLFGGITAMARKLGHTNASTVQGWKARGVIPQRQWPAVLAAAKSHNIALTTDDLHDLPSEAA